MSPYRHDLAFIHDEGFDQFATAAAGVLVAALRRRGVRQGTVVELGCGSGITARLLADAGFRVVGFDLSDAMIGIARARVPEGTFHVGSFVDARIPGCAAVAAVGEVVNYAFDHRNGAAARADLFARVFAALRPGGVLLLDVAGPDRAPADATRTFIDEGDWVVLVDASAENGVLTRKITTFRRDGERYRRDFESHRLWLIAPEDIENELRGSGFGVERVDGYGDLIFPTGLHGFIASKPGP